MRKFYLLLLLSVFGSFANAQPPKNLTLLSTVVFPGEPLSGCWHYNNGANEYAIVGAHEGIAIEDITNPASPQLLFRIPGSSSLWHEVKVQGNYAYAVSEGRDSAGNGTGVQIIDLSNLPFSAPFTEYHGDGAIAGQLMTGHTVTIDGNYLYVNGHNIISLNKGILIFSLADPANPTYVTAITHDYCHDSYVRGNRLFSSEIYPGQFSVFDITNPATPQLLATQQTPGLFNHNTWLNDAGTILFTTDERNATPLAAFDVSDLSNITLIDTFVNTYMSQAEVHNVRVLNDYLINPSYGSQLTLADASRPHNIIETGNYTTGTQLCWEADPYTASGNIIATEMSQDGIMYLFSPSYIRACYLEGTVSDSITGALLPNAGIMINGPNVSAYATIAGDYATGYADSGSYTVTYSANGYTPKTYNVSLANGVLVTLDAKLLAINPGIREDNANVLKVFPNPASVDIISLSSEEEIVSCTVSDITGRVIMASTPLLQKIDISSLPAGSYFVNAIFRSGKTGTVQFIRN